MQEQNSYVEMSVGLFNRHMASLPHLPLLVQNPQ